MIKQYSSFDWSIILLLALVLDIYSVLLFILPEYHYFFLLHELNLCVVGELALVFCDVIGFEEFGVIDAGWQIRGDVNV